jgi:hypothetical protein
MNAKICFLAVFAVVQLFAAQVQAQTAQISIADDLSPGWQDHRSHTLVLRNNANEPMVAVLAVKTFRKVPNTPCFVTKESPIYMIVGGDALIYETKVERVVLSAHAERKVSYNAFAVSLMGEEAAKKPGTQK